MKLHKELTKVIPLSKVLAMLVLFTLPFIGFFAGMRYQEMLDLANIREQEALFTTPKRIPTPTPTIPADWKTYTNKKYNFILKYPANFIVSETDFSTIKDLHPKNKTEFKVDFTNDPDFKNKLLLSKDKSILNVNVDIWKTNEKTLTKAVAEYHAFLGNDNLPNGINRTINDIAWLQSSFSNSSSVPLTEYALLREDRLFVLETSPSNSDLNHTADQILSTFKFLETKKSIINTEGWIKYSNEHITILFPADWQLAKGVKSYLIYPQNATNDSKNPEIDININSTDTIEVVQKRIFSRFPKNIQTKDVLIDKYAGLEYKQCNLTTCFHEIILFTTDNHAYHIEFKTNSDQDIQIVETVLSTVKFN